MRHASINTSLSPVCVRDEHSKYSAAPIFCCSSFPSSSVTGGEWLASSFSSVCGSVLRSSLVPCEMREGEGGKEKYERIGTCMYL